MDMIRPNLFLGDKDDARFIQTRRDPITAILNVAVEIRNQQNRGVLNVKVGMRDSAEDAYQRSAEAVSALKKLIDAGHTVLVHCAHGKSRSPHVIAMYLSEQEGKDYSDVFDDIRSRRPKVLAYSIGEEIWRKYGKLTP